MMREPSGRFCHEQAFRKYVDTRVGAVSLQLDLPTKRTVTNLDLIGELWEGSGNTSKSKSAPVEKTARCWVLNMSLSVQERVA